MTEQNDVQPLGVEVPERLSRAGRVCARLDMSRTTLAALVKAGELDVVYVGTHRRITESSIQRYLERHRHR
jgi:excisionase family DNA binding protein